MTSKYVGKIDLVGVGEIADRLETKRGTVSMWVTRRGKTKVPFPEPDWALATANVWDWETIKAWAIATNRMPA